MGRLEEARRGLRQGQRMPSKLYIEKVRNLYKRAEDATKAEYERDQLRDKAEALDWLEQQDCEVNIRQDATHRVMLNMVEDGQTINSFDAVTLLSAINAARKGGKQNNTNQDILHHSARLEQEQILP